VQLSGFQQSQSGREIEVVQETPPPSQLSRRNRHSMALGPGAYVNGLRVLILAIFMRKTSDFASHCSAHAP
jgi:hypothetical protein